MASPVPSLFAPSRVFCFATQSALNQPSAPTSPLSDPIHRQPTITSTMATELTVQSERAFQKQPHVSLVTKSKTKRPGKGGVSLTQAFKKKARELTLRNSVAGTRMSVWVSVPPRLPLRASTSVCETISIFFAVARRLIHDAQPIVATRRPHNTPIQIRYAQRTHTLLKYCDGWSTCGED